MILHAFIESCLILWEALKLQWGAKHTVSILPTLKKLVPNGKNRQKNKTISMLKLGIVCYLDYCHSASYQQHPYPSYSPDL